MRKTMGTAAVILVAASAALCACSDSEKSLGTDDPVDTTLSLEDFAANWDGYIEAYSLPSGSDRIRVVLDEQGQGTVLFGDGDALAPPTDPDAAYPPSAAGDEYAKPGFDRVYERIAYPVHGTQLDDTRLRLEIHSYDAVSDWCALQTPFYDAQNDMYFCVPNTGGGYEEGTGCFYNGPNGEHIAVSCAKEDLCWGPCTCTQASCSVTQGTVVKLDGALSDDGTKLEGTIVLNNSPYTIRLTRQ
ncbi:MAG: hypothetical protein JW940_35040 [Polyangiaceae bacterium]|nr:hypothetical protein [Polyangiaceae bacterium]